MLGISVGWYFPPDYSSKVWGISLALYAAKRRFDYKETLWIGGMMVRWHNEFVASVCFARDFETCYMRGGSSLILFFNHNGFLTIIIENRRR